MSSEQHHDSQHEHHHGSMHEHNREQGGEILFGHGHEMAHSEHMLMHSVFSLKTDSDFLIEGIKISSVLGIILAMVFTLLITIVYDTVKFMIYMRELRIDNTHDTRDQSGNKTLSVFVTSVSHMSSVILAYIIMLCVMTMNVWLMVSVVLGSGIGHFAIRPLLARKLKLEYSKELELKHTTEEAMPLSDLNDTPGNREEHEDSTSVHLAEEALLNKGNLDV